MVNPLARVLPVPKKKKQNAGPGLEELLISPRPEEGAGIELPESAVGGGSHWNTNRSEAEAPAKKLPPPPLNDKEDLDPLLGSL